ncbi:MAG: ATP-dependent protease [Alphaproteobacteria bacterium]|nr:ATP-dependent protease [Alphaproteobacteria bacterium]
MPTRPLPPDVLRPRCDLSAMGFTTTAELSGTSDVLGQDRAFEAIEFGIGMRERGYNVFVLGPTSAGRHRHVLRLVEARAAGERAPSDWVYVHNFDQSHRPRVIELPCRMGTRLKRDVAQLIEDLRTGIPAIFESDDYRNRRQLIDQEFRERHDAALQQVEQEAATRQIALVRTPNGLALAPRRGQEIITPEEFQRLPEEERKRIEGDLEELQRRLQESLRHMPQWDKERRERIRGLNREVTKYAVTYQIMALRASHMEFADVVSYLDSVEADIIEHSAPMFLESEAEGPAAALQAMLGRHGGEEGGRARHLQFRRYEVNLLVDNQHLKGAPVVHEDNPTVPNLVGRAEHQAELGALLTDFTLLRSGALHRANGGYLILDAEKLLMQPYSWEQLKRTLFAREIRIEAPMQGYFATVTLEPEPIALDAKIILVGDRRTYYLLAQLDPEFENLFKVAADFEDELPRDSATVERYAGLIASLATNAKVRPVERAAVERLIEESSRAAGDAERLTARIGQVRDLLLEANHLAGLAKRDTVAAEDVRKAVELRIRRADRIRERSLEQIHRGTVLIDTDGAKVGTINGLSVMQVGGFAFGRPTRITARVRLGRGEVVDIEREVDLGGPTHSKGVLILSSYLGARYAPDRPLSLRASLVFEQSYGGVDGDSASSTELYAILSALADVPIRQGIAVTGSVNQNGEVQAIGGVNEKIEGFFDVCRQRGLTGAQGVMVPEANVKHLMLREDIVEAGRAGRFSIYPVVNIDQGIEILTGKPAGERGADGRFSEGTINRLVEDRLIALAEARRHFAEPGDGARP